MTMCVMFKVNMFKLVNFSTENAFVIKLQGRLQTLRIRCGRIILPTHMVRGSYAVS